VAEFLEAPEAAPPAPGAGDAARAPLPPPPLGGALCSATLQAARARCFTAQRLLLLLGVVRRMGRAGATPLADSDAAAIRDDLEPRLAACLRASAMALWLAKTPAVCPLGAGAAPGAAVLPAHLEALQLGGPPGGRGAGGSVPSTPRTPGGGASGGGFGRAGGGAGGAAAAPAAQPLAAHLLRGFCEAQPAAAAGAAGGRLGPAVAALLDYLTSGAGAPAAAAPAAPRGPLAAPGAGADASGAPGIEARVLHVGWRLFCAREFAGAGALVTLAGGPSPADAGLAFLLGVSLACRLRGAGGGSGSGGGGSATAAAAARRELLDAASGHLFRAAAGLASPEAAPLRGVLQQLRRRQQRGGGSGSGGGLELKPPPGEGGSGGSGSGAVAPDAVAPRLRLEFFEAVMRLFEAEECLEGALAFARAALGAVDGAYEAEDPARRERQGARRGSAGGVGWW
jgi:hypothetical protein